MRDFLINEKNIDLMSEKENTDYNVKRLLNNENLSQSQCIRFGKIFEGFIKSLLISKGYTLLHEKLVDVKGVGLTSNKGKKDIDLCFIKDGSIFYFEMKLNLGLDSEKSKATDEKVANLTNFLIEESGGINVVSGVLTGWWDREDCMKITVKSPIFFIKDFFDIVGVETTKEEYYEMLSDFGKKL